MMRLDKMLAHSGYGTRKEVKEFIRKGLVMVNGEVIYDDDYKVDEVNDEITILDQEVNYEKMIYLMLNKPDGYISATYDNHDPIVLDLIEGYENRGLFPVGRLDYDTSGVLLFTNDFGKVFFVLGLSSLIKASLRNAYSLPSSPAIILAITLITLPLFLPNC